MPYHVTVRLVLVVVAVMSGCVSNHDAPGTVTFTGDVQASTELGIYKTGADGFTVLAISGGRDVAIDGIHAPTPYIAVLDRTAQIVQLASVEGDPSIDAGLHAQAIGRDATGGVVVLWGIGGLAQTFAHYRSDSLAQEWTSRGTGLDTVLAVSARGDLAFIEHAYDETGFHERVHLIDADGHGRWTQELPGYAPCVWFAPSVASARGEQLAQDVLVFAYSFGVVELASADGTFVPTGSTDACPADGWYSRPIQGTSLTLAL